jgi:hypothetical protein
LATPDRVDAHSVQSGHQGWTLKIAGTYDSAVTGFPAARAAGLASEDGGRPVPESAGDHRSTASIWGDRLVPSTVLPDEIRGVLDALRVRIRRYLLVEGIALVAVVLGILFWVSFLGDWAYFRLSRLELPTWVRSTFLIGTLCVLTLALLEWVLGRWLKRLRTRALALVLERRFPELGDRLITAVELTELDRGPVTDLGGAMQRQAIAEAARAARGLDLTEVFNRRPLQRALIAGIVAVVSIVGLSVADAAAIHRWYSAFLRGDADYWDPYRRTVLSAFVMIPPGEQARPLAAGEVHRHPRGADLVVRVEIPEGKEVPASVSLRYRTAGSSGSHRGHVTMTQVGDRTFRHALARAMDDHQLWVVGGDYTNKQPFRIEVVDEPRIDAVQLACDYPDYTGMDAFADKLVPVQGTQVSLPIGTSFVLRGQTNKPLRGLRLRVSGQELTVGSLGDGEWSGAAGSDSRTGAGSNSPSSPFAKTQTASSPSAGVGSAPGTDSTAGSIPGIEPDGRAFVIPMQLVGPADAGAANPAGSAGDSETRPPDSGRSNGSLPLQMTADAQVQFELFDSDGIVSPEPIRLTIRGIVDLPPVVETRLRGIGRSVTRLARIPVSGTITDDYGVAQARFGYRIDEAPEYAFEPFGLPASGQKELVLGGGGEPPWEHFALRPLELSIGQKLMLTVFAADADNVTGPHDDHGEVYTFSVVSAEDLLAQLYDKELNLRQRFEQVLLEVREARDDLAVHAARSREVHAAADGPTAESPEGAAGPFAELAAAVRTCADRRLGSLRKNHTECRSIEELFGDIRDELVNNRVDTASLLERIEGGILAPLHDINEVDYPQVDEAVALFRLIQERNGNATGAIEASVAAVDGLIERMERVLAEMRRRETFNELVKRLQSILEKQQEIREQTNKARVKSLIEGQFSFPQE